MFFIDSLAGFLQALACVVVVRVSPVIEKCIKFWSYKQEVEEAPREGGQCTKWFLAWCGPQGIFPTST